MNLNINRDAVKFLVIFLNSTHGHIAMIEYNFNRFKPVLYMQALLISIISRQWEDKPNSGALTKPIVCEALVATDVAVHRVLHYFSHFC
jgi:hypothetical protein